MFRTLEAAYWLRLVSTATTLQTSTLVLVHSTAEYSGPVWCRSAHTRPIRPRHQRCLANCGWMSASYTRRQLSHSRRQPSCWASSQRSHTISSSLCRGAWTSAPLNAHLSVECKCTAHQIETPICTRRTTTHQFFWQQQHTCGALGRPPMEWGVVGHSYETPHIHPRHRHPPFRNDPPKKRLWVRLNSLWV